MENQPGPIQHEEQETSNDHCGQFAIHGWREVLFYLKGIQEQKLLVNILLLGGHEFIISSILEIDEKADALILDSVANHPFIRKLAPGAEVRVETSLDQIKIVFDTTVRAVADFEGKPAIEAYIPDSIMRLQRREHFRVMLPIAKPVQCVIPANAVENPGPVSMVVLDISLGGVAISDIRGTFEPNTGDILPDCEIALPEVGLLRVNLLVRSVVQIPGRSGLRKKRIGCSFVDLPHSMASTLQRYIMKLERERRTRM